MKVFAKTIILLLGVLLLLNMALDVVLSRILIQSQSKLYKEWNAIIYDSINADLLVMGSSSALLHYDPHIMDSLLSLDSYNLGIYASHVKRQIGKVEVYRHYQKKKPSFLIMNFCCVGNWSIDEGIYREQYFPYFANPFVRKLIKDQEYFSKGELYVPMYRYAGVLDVVRNAFGEDDSDLGKKECWYKGYYWGMPSEWDGSELAKIDTIRFNPNQEVVDRFDSFLSDLKKDDINVIFVTSPLYIEAAKKIVNLSEFYDFRSHFSEKYDIPVLDYLCDSLFYDTAYFYNATHLNKTGAELFTTKLCHDLDSLGILRNN